MAESLEKPYHHGHLAADLVRIAMTLLEEQGIPSVTLREVARRAGVSAPAVYRHFIGKEALMAAVAARGFAMLIQDFQSATAARDGTRDKLHALGLAYVSFADQHPHLHMLMFGPRLNDIGTGGELTEQANQAFHQLLTASAACLGPNVDDKKALGAAIALWSLVHGYATLRRDGQLSGLPPEMLPPPEQIITALVLDTP